MIPERLTLPGAGPDTSATRKRPQKASGAGPTEVQNTGVDEAFSAEALAAPGLRLLVFHGESLTAQVLPAEGELLIGRGEDADLAIDSPKISRQHARLRLGAQVELEDLGSVNGTRVLGRRLAAGERVGLRPGDAFEVGQAVLVLQREPSVQPAPTRRLATHGYLESRLEEACARGRPASLARLSLRGAAAMRQVQAQLHGALAPDDLVASYAPGELEVLILGSAPAEVTRRLDALAAELEHAGAPVELRLAHFPRDARDAQGLIARTGEVTAQDAKRPVVRAPETERLYALAERVARGAISVLILGETGSGKEVLAEAIHAASPRAERPFLAVHVGGLAESLVDSELFGHARGAFTGATEAKAGLLESAQGGTVFLDEIGELRPSAQVKLLRVLEKREITRVGESRPRPLDVRFIAATHRDLRALAARGAFREDLYFRLNGVTLEVPPLRARRSEIVPLAEHFAAEAARQLGGPPPRFSPEFAAALERHDWPGNVRELRNTIERAVLLAEGPLLTPETLPLERIALADAGDAAPLLPADAESERARIERALQACGGNQKLAAAKLGISRRTLLNRLDALEIRRPRKGR